jgi:hypothetical protein
MIADANIVIADNKILITSQLKVVADDIFTLADNHIVIAEHKDVEADDSSATADGNYSSYPDSNRRESPSTYRR